MKKMFLSRSILLTLILLSTVVLTSCGKPRLFGKEMTLEPVTKVYPVKPIDAVKAVKEALAVNGYNVQKQDLPHGILETHWQPTSSDSHYVVVFGRQDRGTVGAYHRLLIEVCPVGSDSSTVKIVSQAKSIISNVHSTGIEEEKIFDKIADFTRKANIDVTNVGIR
ncbi:MAG: hypothetical protein JNK65_09255 [Deltaproteobacteria bacterium]|nr:hypothetical protein [Deltaproteobacteria bacterium]